MTEQPGVWSEVLDTWIVDAELSQMYSEAADLQRIVNDLHAWMDSTHEEDPEPWSALAELEDHVEGLINIADMRRKAIERRNS